MLESRRRRALTVEVASRSHQDHALVARQPLDTARTVLERHACDHDPSTQALSWLGTVKLYIGASTTMTSAARNSASTSSLRSRSAANACLVASSTFADAGCLLGNVQSVAGGFEPSISLVVDAIFPPEHLTDALLAFKDRFPTVATRVHGESLGAAADMVVGGEADLGLLNAFFAPAGQLELRRAASVELVHVCAPGRPLAAVNSTASQPIPTDDVEDHLQPVLSDRSPRTRDQDHGVWSASTWRLADLSAKHAMLRAGLGWGSLPLQLAANDLAAGRLVKLHVGRPSDSTGPILLEMSVARRLDKVLGPAGRWFLKRLAGGLT
jgi:DNA-binding transcriptional LysR family regulator